MEALDRRIGGERSGSSGHCYVLGTVGQRLLRPGRRARRVSSLGAAFVAHAVATTELAVELSDAQQRGEIDGFTIEPEPSCWRTFVGRGGQLDTLKPDLFVAINLGDVERRWFVEVDRSTESLVRLDVKCRHYLAYLRTGDEQAQHGVFPKVLWTVLTDKRAAQLRAVVSSLPPPADRLFEIALHQHAITNLKGGANP